MRHCIMLVSFFLSPFFLATQRGLDRLSIRFFIYLDMPVHLLFYYLHLISDSHTVVVYLFNSVFNRELYLIKLYLLYKTA